MVYIIVTDEEEFKQAEMTLFALKFNRHIQFSIYVTSTDQIWLYETQYMPQFEYWLVVTK